MKQGMASPPATLKPRRGRPSLARVSAIDRAVIAAARRMFLSDGFDAVAMEQVAAEAGVSKGTLYARHPSKERLFAAVIRDLIRDWSEEASREDHKLTDDIEQRLHHHARIVAAWMRRPDVIAVNQIMQAVRERFPDLARTMYEAGYLFAVNLIARDIETAAERDGRPARNAQRVARLLVSSIGGFQAQELLSGELEAAALDEHAGFVVDVLMAARRDW